MMRDRANCVPRALSVATGLALDETTAILAAHGRKANRGTRTARAFILHVDPTGV